MSLSTYHRDRYARSLRCGRDGGTLSSTMHGWYCGDCGQEFATESVRATAPYHMAPDELDELRDFGAAVARIVLESRGADVTALVLREAARIGVRP